MPAVTDFSIYRRAAHDPQERFKFIHAVHEISSQYFL
jgi:hypothetical protein